MAEPTGIKGKQNNAAAHASGNGKKMPPQTRTMLKFLRLLLYILFNLLFYVVVIAIIIRVSNMAYDFTYEIFGSQVMEEEPGHDVEFVIIEGESTTEVAEQLEYSRLIGNRKTFYIRAKLATDDKHPILPGKYLLNTSMNYQQILDTITDSAAAMGEEKEE